VQQRALRGAEVFAKQLSEALRSRGNVTKTVYLYASTDRRFSIESGDVELGASPRHPLERMLIQPAVASALKGQLEQFSPDIVQLNGGRTVKYGAMLRHFRGQRGWVSIYRNIGDPDFWIRGRAKRLAYRAAVFSGVDGIVALSEASGRIFRETFGVRSSLEVIPTAVSPEHQIPAEARALVRRRMGAEEAAAVVLYVGKLAPEKRVDRLISAFAAMRATAPGARLWLVGEGPEQRSLERLAAQLRLEGRVSFVGTTRDVASYYAAADVFALTSDSEGIPGVLLEAAYAALPIVATDVGLVRECVIDGESALLARPHIDAVADAMGRLVRDPELRLRLGQRGRRLVEDRFLMSDIAQRYEAFYRRVIAARSA
jgi:glycosyltransferase involved in cell wall biosynthesis